MIITFQKVGTGAIENRVRPDLPEGVTGFRLIEDHGDTMTVDIQTDLTTAELVAAIPSYVPEQTSAGKFWVALQRKDAEIRAAVEQLVQSDDEMRLAAQHEPTISRHGQRVLQVQAWCQASGFPHVTDAWLDELFREAVQVQL